MANLILSSYLLSIVLFRRPITDGGSNYRSNGIFSALAPPLRTSSQCDLFVDNTLKAIVFLLVAPYLRPVANANLLVMATSRFQMRLL